MTPMPNTVFSHYETILKKRAVTLNCYADYKKWLRYTHCVPVRTVKEPRSPLDF